MAKNMTTAILTDEIAQVRPQTHVGDGRLVIAPFLNGKALEQDKSLPAEEILAQFSEICAQTWKNKFVLLVSKFQ